MPLVLTGNINEVISGRSLPGRLEVKKWGFGIAFESKVYVLNLYAEDGNNYPESIPEAALAGTIELLSLAKQHSLTIYYWPGSDPVLFVGKFDV